jgi:hypothetical protein
MVVNLDAPGKILWRFGLSNFFLGNIYFKIEIANHHNKSKFTGPKH